MNNKGFTLIELIITILLLALITSITIPVIGDIREKHKVSQYYELLNNIANACKLYVTDNRYDNNFNIKCSSGVDIYTFEVSLKDLKDESYISDSVKNPIDNTDVPEDTNVSVAFNCSTKEFSYKIDKAEYGYEGVNGNSDGICYYSNGDGNRQNDVCR